MRIVPDGSIVHRGSFLCSNNFELAFKRWQMVHPDAMATSNLSRDEAHNYHGGITVIIVHEPTML